MGVTLVSKTKSWAISSKVKGSRRLFWENDWRIIAHFLLSVSIVSDGSSLGRSTSNNQFRVGSGGKIESSSSSICGVKQANHFFHYVPFEVDAPEGTLEGCSAAGMAAGCPPAGSYMFKLESSPKPIKKQELKKEPPNQQADLIERGMT